MARRLRTLALPFLPGNAPPELSEEDDDEDDDEERLPPLSTPEVRKLARGYLTGYDDPKVRRLRLEHLHDELTRRDRRALKIPSLDEIESARPPAPPSRPESRECPRCHEQTADLAAHRDVCSKRRIKAAPLSPAPSEDDGRRKAVDAEAASPQVAEVVRTPPTAPDSAAPAPPASTPGRDASLELVERCLVLADMLWPDEVHEFRLGLKAGQWGAEVWKLDGDHRRALGDAPTKGGAVHALADALRAEVAERARQAADLAKLLED